MTRLLLSFVYCVALAAQVVTAPITGTVTFNLPVPAAAPAPVLVASPAPPVSISVLNGPDACQPVLRPFSSQPHVGGQLCQVPAAGSVPLGGRLVDFNFGGTAVALTPPDQTFVHGYSLPSPLSATNRYVGVTDTDGRHWALDRTSGAHIRIPGDSAAPMWDTSDDDVLYYLAPTRTQILKHSVSSGVDTVAAEFAGIAQHINNGGSTHNSSDGWTSVWSEPDHLVCAVSLANGAHYCADYLAPEVRADAVPFNFIDYSVITDIDLGTGKRYVLLMAAPSLAVWSVDQANGRLVFETRGPELLNAQGFNNPKGNQDGVCDAGENCLSAPHGDADMIDGVQYFVMMIDTAGEPCERTLVALPIAAGAAMVTKRVTVATFGYCSSAYDWPDYHIGCAPRTGACSISTTTNGAAPYGGQVLVMRDLTHLVKLSFHHSAPSGGDTYWYFPRAGISADGRYIVFDSNMGQPDAGNGFAHEQVFIMSTK